jgi:phage gp16-like protein
MGTIDQRRRKLIGAVHAAAKAHGIEDDDRRDLMQRVTGKRSLKDMSLADIGAVLDDINGAAGEARPAAKRNSPPDALEMKARALWHSLGLLGGIDRPTLRALDEFTRRQTGVTALRFATPTQKNQVIEALKDWCLREGFEVPVTEGDGGKAAKIALLQCLWKRLGDTGALEAPNEAGLSAWACKYAGCWTSIHNMEPRQLDDAAVALARWWRKWDRERPQHG